MISNITSIPYYVYKITLVSTGQYYFGSRYGHVTAGRLPEHDLGIHYFSSSKQIKDLIDLYGLEQTQFDIIKKDSDISHIFWLEQELIQKHIQDQLCLNIWYQDPNTKSNRFLITGLAFWSKDGQIIKSLESPGQGWIKERWKWWTKDGNWKKAVKQPA